MTLRDRVAAFFGRKADEERLNQNDWAQQWFNYAGNNYGLSNTMPRGSKEETPENSFTGYINGAYKSSGVVFAAMLTQQLIFSEARLVWQDFNQAKPGDISWDDSLNLFVKPWPNADTGEMLGRAIQDVQLAGNHYILKEFVPGSPANSVKHASAPGWRLRRLRPDWVTIILTAAPDKARKSDVAGYLYRPGNTEDRDAWELFPIDGSNGTVAHWSFIPDPDAQYRGMSPLTPVLTDVAVDKAATKHKSMFFRNGATPNIAVSFKDTVSHEEFKEFMQTMNDTKHGVEHAYECLDPDTEVAMWDGRRVRAADVAVGEQVVSWDDGRAVPGTVADSRWQPDSPIITVTTERGRVIKTNDRHPFLARRVVGGKKYRSDEQWINAAELRVGDNLVTGLGWANDEVADSVSIHQAWTLGELVGDGCMVSSTPVVSAWEKGIRDRLEIEYVLNSTGKGHDYRILGVRKLCVDSGIMGKRSWEKRIPDSIMSGSAKVKAAFLSGLIDADGHVTDPSRRASAEVGITSTSKLLLTDAQHVLASLGVNSSVFRVNEASAGIRECWRLIATGNAQAETLNSILDLAHSRKAQRLADYATKSVTKKQNRSAYDRIASVEVGLPGPTVGLEIDGYHNHVTGGVVTHNTLYLGGGADVQVIGANIQQMDFRSSLGHSETRVCMALRVHPTIVGIAEGMHGSTLNDGNFKAAKNLLADGAMRPMWRSLVNAYSVLLDVPAGKRLWYDDSDIAFLRQDRQETAEVQATQSQTIAAYIQSGYTADSSRDAVLHNDLALLEHTGLFSVQLLPPGTVSPAGGNADTSEPSSPASKGDSKANPKGQAPPKATTTQGATPKKPTPTTDGAKK